MIRNRGSVEIERPIDEVFRLTNDHLAEWSVVVVENEILEAQPNGVGTKFRTVTEENGTRMEFQGVVTRHDPPHISAIRMTGKAFDIEAEYRFDDLQGKTRVTQLSSVQGKGLFRLFLLLAGWLVKKTSCNALEEELASLKSYCEGRADGATR